LARPDSEPREIGEATMESCLRVQPDSEPGEIGEAQPDWPVEGIDFWVEG